MSERDCLFDIMRLASYLPLHSPTRVTIEITASERLRAVGAVPLQEDPEK